MRNRFPTLLRIALLVLLSLLYPGTPNSPPAVRASVTDTLTYVESSAGLIPPSMEGGRTEVEMGDVNGDGFLDLVSIGDHGSPYVNTDQHGVMVWFGDGTGNWAVYQNGDFGYGGVALGDVNGDGLVDVGYGMHHDYAPGDFGDQLLEVALGDGTGMNWTPWDDGLATNGETWGMFGSDFADVDNDGDLDLGSISFGCCAGVHVYLNQGDGTWIQSFGFLGGNSDMHFVFGDVNGDGNADFAVSHQYGALYLGDGAGGFTLDNGNLPALELYGVALGDVDHDGRDDLAFCDNNGGVQVWGWTAPGTWQDLSNGLPVSGSYEAAQIFDMDMDGHLDVVAFGGGQVRVWGGDGIGNWTQIASFTTPSPGYLSAFRVGGDADHNGYPDIILVADEGNWPNDQNHTRFFKETSTPSTLQLKPVFPLGHETFLAGGVVFVDWLSAVPDFAPGTVTLELSTHGPSGPWSNIASGLVNNGRYQWHLPQETPTTDEAYIRYTLTASDTVMALTPAPFNILGTSVEPIFGLQAFNDSPTTLGETTTLTATVISGTNVAYTWVFGDGWTGQGAVVTHTYPQIGAYTATVTATNSLSTATASTPVLIYEQPIFGLVALNDSPTPLGETTTFTATVISGTNVAYTWAFGDGATAEGAVVTHTYPAVGPYLATLTATNSLSTVHATTPVTITDQPISGLLLLAGSPTALGATTAFTASITAGSNVTATWDFGDGSPIESSAMLPGIPITTVHIYTSLGTYTAVLTATNSIGHHLATTQVTMADLTPPQVLATSPLSGAVGVPLTATLHITFSEPISPSSFIFTSTPDPGGWSSTWDPAGALISLTHAPFSPNTAYTITLVAASDMAGNPLPAEFVWRFTTAPLPPRVYIPLVIH